MTIPMEASVVVLLVMPGKVLKRKRDGASFGAFPFYYPSGELKRQAGYTLIELAAVIILIGIMLPALIGFFSGTLKNTVESEMINRAIFLAREKMEEICTDKYGHGFTYMGGPALYPQENIDQFVRTVTISGVKRNDIDGMEIVVTVSHPVMINSYSITQFFTNYDEYKN